MRGIAAYSVLAAHAIDMTMGDTPLLTPVLGRAASQIAYFGMSTFFVLSGFVIHYNYIGSFTTQRFYDAVRRFFIARFARLYPLYALAILLNIYYVATPFFAGRPGAAAAYLTMTASWFNLEQLIYPPAWSISTEWFFYFVFALIAPGLWRTQKFSFWLLLALLIAAPLIFLLIYSERSTVYPVLTTLFWHDQAVSAAPDYWFWYYAPYVRIAEFLAGMLTSAVYLNWGSKVALGRRSCRFLELVACGWCLAVIAIGTIYSPNPFGPLASNFVFAPGLVGILIVAISEHSVVGRLLGSEPLVFAGEISYSVYIFQWWGKFLVLKWWDTMLAWWGKHVIHAVVVEPKIAFYGYLIAVGKIVAIALLTTGMAIASYYLYEWPTRRILRHVLTKLTSGFRKSAQPAA